MTYWAPSELITTESPGKVQEWSRKSPKCQNFAIAVICRGKSRDPNPVSQRLKIKHNIEISMFSCGAVLKTWTITTPFILVHGDDDEDNMRRGKAFFCRSKWCIDRLCARYFCKHHSIYNSHGKWIMSMTLSWNCREAFLSCLPWKEQLESASNPKELLFR